MPPPPPTFSFLLSSLVVLPPLLSPLLLCAPLLSRVLPPPPLSLVSFLVIPSPLFSPVLWCPQAENELAEIGGAGCTFWQYNPAETYQVSGLTSEDSVPLEPGRVRFENQGVAQNTETKVLRIVLRLLLHLDL